MRFCLVCAGALAIAVGQPVSAQGAPALLSYQGQLTNSVGAPITSPTAVRFTLLWGGTANENPSTGKPVYQEDATVAPDGEGVFHHLIGAGTPTSGCDEDRDGTANEPCALAPPDFPNSATVVYLELRVDPAGTNNVLLPRQRIASVGYALSADRLNSQPGSFYLDTSSTDQGKSGSLGVGTANPSAKLHVSGGTGSVELLIEADTDNSNEDDQPVITLSQDGGLVQGVLGYLDANNDLTLKNTNGSLMLGTDDATRVSIAQDGATTFTGPSGYVSINSYANNSVPAIQMKNDAATNDWVIYSDDTSSGDLYIVSRVAAADVHIAGQSALTADLDIDGNLTVAGDIRVDSLDSAGATDVCRNGSNNLATCSSARRFKESVEDLHFGGIETVQQLRPVEFRWKDGGEEDLGFVAEDVAAVQPILATYDDAGDLVGVKYRQITAVLVKAIQEQQQVIEDLRTELDDIKAKFLESDR